MQLVQINVYKSFVVKNKKEKGEGPLARHAATHCVFHRHYRCSFWLVIGHSCLTRECYYGERTAFYYISHFVVNTDI